MSAIHDAAANGDVAKVKSLINASSMVIEEVDSRDFIQERPLHVAAKRGHVAVIDLLLKSGANINGTSGFGTPLHDAANMGKMQAVEFLVKNGANVNAVGAEGHTPLTIAQLQGRDAIVQYLIAHGAITKKAGCMGVLLFVVCCPTLLLCARVIFQ